MAGTDAMKLDPRIGVLNGGKFYCYPNGNGRPEFVGTLAEVEAALGIRPTPGSQPAPAPASSAMPARARTSGGLRDYEVTITPKVVSYAGAGTFGEYTVTVCARSHSEAIKMARQDRREAEGRHGVAATYRARVIERGRP